MILLPLGLYVPPRIRIFMSFPTYFIVSRSQTSFLAQGVIACNISARTKKGSGMVHSADSFLTPPLVQRC